MARVHDKELGIAETPLLDPQPIERARKRVLVLKAAHVEDSNAKAQAAQKELRDAGLPFLTVYRTIAMRF